MTENISYWLIKSEPNVYGIKHLKDEGTTLWDGIRNYQARNFMRQMNIGDKAFFYHSNCNPPGIVGLAKIVRIGIIDPTQFNTQSKYFDPKSSIQKPRWDCAEVQYLGEFNNFLSLGHLRENFNEEELPLLRKGNRLSILPITNKIATSLITMLGDLNN